MKFPLARVVAWVLFLAAVFVVVMVADAWENPFANAASPVLTVLPADAPGCGEGCK